MVCFAFKRNAADAGRLLNFGERRRVVQDVLPIYRRIGEVFAHGDLQAAHVFQSVLLKDGSEVGLGYVVGKGAVAEDDGGFTGRLQGLVPGHETEGERLHVGLRDGSG
jgi:hypothetical protein